MFSANGPVRPATLSWQDNGELSPEDLFSLVNRLRAVEPDDHCHELWRLGKKYLIPGMIPAKNCGNG
jgi:hypothetical protein